MQASKIIDTSIGQMQCGLRKKKTMDISNGEGSIFTHSHVMYVLCEYKQKKK